MIINWIKHWGNLIPLNSFLVCILSFFCCLDIRGYCHKRASYGKSIAYCKWPRSKQPHLKFYCPFDCIFIDQNGIGWHLNHKWSSCKFCSEMSGSQIQMSSLPSFIVGMVTRLGNYLP